MTGHAARNSVRTGTAPGGSPLLALVAALFAAVGCPGAEQSSTIQQAWSGDLRDSAGTLRAEFTATGAIRLVSQGDLEGGAAREMHGAPTLLTRACGRGDAAESAPAPAVPLATPQGGAWSYAAEVARWRRRVDACEEWWTALPEGLQQGWSLSKPPPGSGPLLVDLAISGTVGLDGDGLGAWFESNGVRFRWRGLTAFDARGTPLAVAARKGPAGLLIEVADAGAVYPITIDPIVTVASWSPEWNQYLAHLGTTVAAAGDVNADGWDDVLLAAPDFDNGQTDEGKVLLYLGSAAGLSTSSAWGADGGQVGAHLGFEAVAGAGDVNGDGFGDVVLGAYLADGTHVDAGEARLYLGSSAGLGASAPWTVLGTQTGGELGRSVAGAGDVDGDGFADLIVGEPAWDAGGGDEGRALLFAGSPSGPAAGPTEILLGTAAGARLGDSVAGACDVDGDGYADVLIGAPGFTNGSLVGGAASLYRGGVGGLASTAWWMGLGSASGDNFGGSVAGVGDIDGDGFTDLLIGASGADNGQVDEGRAYVFLGSATGPGATAAWIGESNQGGAAFGSWVASARDLNGDGYADLAVSAPAFDNGQSGEGRVSLYYGSPGGPGPAPGATWDGEATAAAFGTGLAGAGDVDGDGFGDLVVGAPGGSNGSFEEGRVYLFAGHGAAIGPAPSSRPEGAQASAVLGLSLALVGDTDADGFDDVLAGAYGFDLPSPGIEGVARVYAGSATGLADPPAAALSGLAADSPFGWAVAGAGDVNDDGYADVIVGANQSDRPEVQEGAAFLYLGSPGGVATTQAWSAEGEQAGAGLGAGLAGAGDIDGDGFDDLLIGSPGFDGAFTNEGRVALYLGGPAGPATQAAWTVLGGQDGAALGGEVAGVGDLDADGFADFALGLPSFDGLATDDGAVWVYPGGAAGPGPRSRSYVPGQGGAAFGGAAQAAGDVNGDGHADLVVGASSWDGSALDEGAAFLYLGGPAGAPPAPSWTYVSGQAGAQLGAAVASAGDTDGDGYGDIAIGAPGYDNDQNDEGRVLLFPGGPSGPEPTAEHHVESDQSGSFFGAALGGAGDVDGDGFGDLVVGSPYYQNGEPFEGALWLFRGAAAEGGSVAARPIRARMTQPVEGPPILPGHRSEEADAFGLVATGHGPFGRAPVRLDIEVEPAGTALDGFDLVVGSGWADSGAEGATLVQNISGLVSGEGYHWRARVRPSPSGAPAWPAGPWFQGGRSGDPLGVHVRTACLSDLDADRVCDAPDEDQDGDGSPDIEDCAPDDAAIHPGAVEDCDPIDTDCDTDLVDGFPDTDSNDVPDCIQPPLDVDGDGATNEVDCDDLADDTYPGAPEVCDADDNDCDAAVPADELDGDGDGESPCNGDCDDTDPWISTLGQEVCDLVDANCDGSLLDDSFSPGPNGDFDGDGLPDCGDPDGDADGVVGSADCDNLDPTSTTTAIDGDCDELLTAGDCDDADPNATARVQDGDCDGVDDRIIFGSELGIEFALIPAGTFTMGCLAGRDYTLQSSCPPEEAPAEITLTRPFWMGRYEVTRGQWIPRMGTASVASYLSGPAFYAHPADAVASAVAASFANVLSVEAGLPECYSCSGSGLSFDCNHQVTPPQDCTGYRLPTEAEWEYAARGDEAFVYPGSNSLGDVATQSPSVTGPWSHADPGGSFQSNAFGLFDMSGNVGEAVSDSWDGLSPVATRGSVDPFEAPLAAGLLPYQAARLRGGYFNAPSRLQSRGGVGEFSLGGAGLRLVRTAPDQDGDSDPDVTDCAIADPTIHHAAAEVCDTVDDDCDGLILESFADTDGDSDPDCLDLDDDGDLDPDTTDCNPLDPLVFSGAPESCDAVDSNCDGDLLDGAADFDLDGTPDCADQDDDGDGAPDLADCEPLDSAVFPGAFETCDGVDDDCDGSLVGPHADTDLDLLPDCEDLDDDEDGTDDTSDCAPLDSAVFPGAAESCDLFDSDCDLDLVDGAADTDSDLVADCVDDDDDGDGTADGSDCDGLDAAIHPGAPESCDAVDSDCDLDLLEGDADLDGDLAPDCIDPDDDGDGAPDASDCAPLDATRFPGATEICDATDQDCDPASGDLWDGDGDGASLCEGDCNDADPGQAPGLPELCDGLDQDCDPLTDELADGDGDGVSACEGDCDDTDPALSPGEPELCDGVDGDCNDALPPEELDDDGDGSVPCEGDCDDGDSTVGPGAEELCDGIDQACDGITQPLPEDDADLDGVSPCAGDCEPTRSTAFPGAVEICNGRDDDCDTALAPPERDADGDGAAACAGDCDDSNAMAYPAAPEPAAGPDLNCDGLIGDADADGDGYTVSQGDCDDGQPEVHPGASETCDGFDTDCADGPLEQEVVDLDWDGAADCLDCGPLDPFVRPGAVELCDGLDGDCDGIELSPGEVDRDGDGIRPCAGDCDDDDALVAAGLAEQCPDGLDNDCDGEVDNDVDVDLDGYSTCGGDCRDREEDRFPGAVEHCDGEDDNCDGTIDEGFDIDGDGQRSCGGDCDDSEPTVFRLAPAICNDDLDNDCLASTQEWVDFDGDGSAACDDPPDCWEGQPLVGPLQQEACDGEDNDCDGEVDEGFDPDGDGSRPCTFDCSEGDASVGPHVAEICGDMVDQDCDGEDAPCSPDTADPGGDDASDPGAGCEVDCDSPGSTALWPLVWASVLVRRRRPPRPA